MPSSKILVAVDGSPASLRALDIAIDMLAQKPGASLGLLHVWNLHAIELLGAAEALDTNWLREADKRAADEALKDAVAKCQGASVDFEALVRSGHVAETITLVAREGGYDQIVMGTRGLGGVEGLLLGSVATQVVHLAEVPITLTK